MDCSQSRAPSTSIQPITQIYIQHPLTHHAHQYHTPANVAKMARGEPLTDADRWDWLILLRDEAIKTLQQQQQPSSRQPGTPSGVILTCSALKRKYRDILRIASLKHPSIRVHFVFLRATEALLMDRVRARQNHYMKDYMVRSQFESLEAPAEDEGDVMGVDAGGSSTEVQALAVGVVEGVMREDNARVMGGGM
jgi:gluconokinase